MRFSSLKWALIPLFLLGGVYLYRTISLERSFREIPKTVVNFEALKADGSRTDYASEKGTATLIVLSASWCPGCLMEIPMLQMVHWNYDAMNALGNPGVIPVSYLVDNADNIDKVFVGDADESELRRRIEKLLGRD